MADRIRYFKCINGSLKTRGEYGVAVAGARTTEPDDPEGLYTFDPDTGDVRIASVGDPDFVEVTEEEYHTL